MTQTLNLQAASPLSRAVNSIGGVVANRVFSILRALKHRQDAQMLAGLDERMLKDIGLTRSDLRDAYAEPIWRDPTAVLVACGRTPRRTPPGHLRAPVDHLRAVDRARDRLQRAADEPPGALRPLNPRPIPSIGTDPALSPPGMDPRPPTRRALLF